MTSHFRLSAACLLAVSVLFAGRVPPRRTTATIVGTVVEHSAAGTAHWNGDCYKPGHNAKTRGEGRGPMAPIIRTPP